MSKRHISAICLQGVTRRGFLVFPVRFPGCGRRRKTRKSNFEGPLRTTVKTCLNVCETDASRSFACRGSWSGRFQVQVQIQVAENHNKQATKQTNKQKTSKHTKNKSSKTNKQTSKQASKTRTNQTGQSALLLLLSLPTGVYHCSCKARWLTKAPSRPSLHTGCRLQPHIALTLTGEIPSSKQHLNQTSHRCLTSFSVARLLLLLLVPVCFACRCLAPPTISTEITRTAARFSCLQSLDSKFMAVGSRTPAPISGPSGFQQQGLYAPRSCRSQATHCPPWVSLLRPFKTRLP